MISSISCFCEKCHAIENAFTNKKLGIINGTNLMTKDIYMKMEKQAMHTDIKILKFNCNFFYTLILYNEKIQKYFSNI